MHDRVVSFDPVACHVGGIGIRWYGLAYLAGFAIAYGLLRRRLALAHFTRFGWEPRDAGDIVFWGIIGAFLGGRLGYVVFFAPKHFLAHPGELLNPWAAGRSYHGGLAGVFGMLALYVRAKKRPWVELLDVLGPTVPMAMLPARLANFINGEHWGRAVSWPLPWAVVFPRSGSDVLRHPAPLYEALVECLVFFWALWLYARRERPLGRVAGSYLIGLGVLRFGLERFREPELEAAGLFGLSPAQWLCIPMVIAGAVMVGRSRRVIP